MIRTDNHPSMVRAVATKEKGGTPEDARRKGKHMSNVASIVGETTLISSNPAKKFVTRSAIEYAGTVEMSPAAWAIVLDNPRQRDTEARARRATHLLTPHPSHCKVNMAELPDGRRYKLDGHTRSLLWKQGQVRAPDVLYVDVWNCRSLEEAKNLYSTFDSKMAVETTSDQIYGAKKEADIEFESAHLKNGRFASGMAFAHLFLHGQGETRRINTYDLVRQWKAELKLLDRCLPTPRRFHTGITAAALLTFRRYGEDALDFWSRFAAGGGVKSNGVVDPVQALEERMERRRGENRLGGATNIQGICGIAISAYERDRHGETYLAERLDEKDNSGKKLRASGIKTTKGDSFRDWMIAAKNSPRRVI